MSALATYMRKRCFLDMGWVIFGTALLLVMLEWVLQLPHLKADYHSLQAFEYAYLLLPRNVYASLPIVILIMGLVSYQRLTQQGIWLAAMVCGCAQRKLLFWMGQVMLLWVLVWVVIGEGFGPSMTMQAKQK